MVLELVILGGLMAAAGALARRRTSPTSAAPGPAAERTPWTLQRGDVVFYGERDYVVDAVLTFEEEGPRFREVVLNDGGEGARLLVRPQDPVAFLRKITPPEGASTLPDRLEFAARAYRLIRRGHALLKAERWPYADYEAPPGRLLLVRLCPFGGIDAYAGEIIAARGLLEILEGGG